MTKNFEQITRRMLGSKVFPKTKKGMLSRSECRKAFKLGKTEQAKPQSSGTGMTPCLGKHLERLWPSVRNLDGKKVVDDLFPLAKLAVIAKKHGSATYSTETEKATVAKLVRDYGQAPSLASNG
jgi:hypothetical protein